MLQNQIFPINLPAVIGAAGSIDASGNLRLNSFASAIPSDTYAVSYGLEIRGGGGRVRVLDTPAAPTFTNAPTAGTAFYYFIVAIDKFGNKTMAGPPSTGVAAATTPALTWAAVPGAVSYDVLRWTVASLPVGNTLTFRGNTTATTFADNTATAATAYTTIERNATGDLDVDGNVGLANTTIYASNIADFAEAVHEAASAFGYTFVDTVSNKWTIDNFNGTAQVDWQPRRLFSTYGLNTFTSGVTTEQDISTGTGTTLVPVGYGIRQIPKNPPAGLMYRIKANGVFTHAVATAANLTFRLRLDSLAAGPIILTIVGAMGAAIVTNAPWSLEAHITIQTTGPAGSLMCHGNANPNFNVAGQSNVNTASVWTDAATAAIANHDTTIDHQILLSAAFSVAQAGNTISCHQFLLDQQE